MPVSFTSYRFYMNDFTERTVRTLKSRLSPYLFVHMSRIGKKRVWSFDVDSSELPRLLV